jgi:hypothetical protein
MFKHENYRKPTDHVRTFLSTPRYAAFRSFGELQRCTVLQRVFSSAGRKKIAPAIFQVSTSIPRLSWNQRFSVDLSNRSYATRLHISKVKNKCETFCTITALSNELPDHKTLTKGAQDRARGQTCNILRQANCRPQLFFFCPLKLLSGDPHEESVCDLIRPSCSRMVILRSRVLLSHDVAPNY